MPTKENKPKFKLCHTANETPDFVKQDLMLKKQVVKLINTIDAEQFRALASWLDKIDKEKGNKSNEVQRDLRKFAKIMDKVADHFVPNE